MEYQEKEHLGRIKHQAYNKGYLDGYRRGLEDSKAGAVDHLLSPDLLDKPIQFLNWSVRPFNSLDRAGYRTVRDIVALRSEDIWKIRNLGRKGLHEVAQALWDNGIRASAWSEWL